MEFLFLDLIDLVLVTGVDPVDEVEHLDRLREELVVDLCTLDDVQRQDILQLHHELVEHLRWHDCHEFDSRDGRRLTVCLLAHI